MAGLQRFVTYIYKYEDDEKKENAGFAKVEIRGNICRVEVHIRNMPTEQPEATVYLFARNADIIHGIPVGNIIISRGSGDVRYAFELAELRHFGKTIEEMEGLFIPVEDNVYLASQWNEGTIKREFFHIIKEGDREETVKEPQNTEEQEVAEQEVAEQGAAEQTVKEQIAAEQSVKEQIAVEQTVKERIATESVDSVVQATELPLEEFQRDAGWQEIFQNLRLKLEVFFPFEGKQIECVRMQLNDLKELPQKYWYLGNNSFLLHGFFNYKHLILGEQTDGNQKEYFVGVPGVFQNQERIMAAMFGFPEFRTAQNAEYKTGNFGYWYRVI